MSGSLAEGFLNDIVANIDDDTPRLVYSDWLEENGHHDRAEFIRIQVERARLPAWDAAQVGLRLREEALLRLHREEWLSELPTIEGAKWEGFRRGIVAEVSFASFEAMRANAHHCRAVAPVEAITVRYPRRGELGQAAAPIAELRELDLTGRPDDESELEWLAESPQLATIHVLTARGLWPEALTYLVSSPHFASLRKLRLPGNTLGNVGMAAIIRSASMTGLEELNLSGRGVVERYREDLTVSPPGMQALASWAGLRNIRTLNLSDNDLGRVGLQALLRSPNCGGLKSLTLRGNRLDGSSMAEFNSAFRGLSLESLDLGENLLKEVGVEYLAMAPCLRELKSLRIDRCEVPLAGARVFARKATFLDGLRVLDVAHNHFGPAGLTALLERKPSALHTLGLRDNDIFDRGVTLLAEAEAANGLLEVDLSLNGLTYQAGMALGGTAHLQNLMILHLLNNDLRESDRAALRASALGKRLAVLEMDEAPQPRPSQGGESDIPF